MPRLPRFFVRRAAARHRARQQYGQRFCSECLAEQAVNNPTAFLSLVGRVLPLQVSGGVAIDFVQRVRKRASALYKLDPIVDPLCIPIELYRLHLLSNIDWEFLYSQSR